MISRRDMFRNASVSHCDRMTIPTRGDAADYLSGLLKEWVGTDGAGRLAEDLSLVGSVCKEIAFDFGLRQAFESRDPHLIAEEIVWGMSVPGLHGVIFMIESELAKMGRLVDF